MARDGPGQSVGAGPCAAAPRAPLVLTPAWGPRGPKPALRFAGAAPTSLPGGAEAPLALLPLRHFAAFRADFARRQSGATPARGGRPALGAQWAVGSRQTSFNERAPQRELGLEAARECVLARVAEHVAADGAALRRGRAEQPLGRVLAAAVVADRDYPPFRRALRDGYAVRAADCAAAGAVLRLLGTVPAGQESALVVEPGTCAAIMTGAPVPAGADAVAMVERSERRGAGVVLAAAVRAGEHIAAVGSDLRQGAVIAAAGRRLDPAALAALASVGCARPELYLPSRVALLSTGDELVEANETPGGAQIRDANGPGLAALALRAGAEVVRQERVRDDAGALGASLDRGLADCDLWVCSGGASVGAFDLVAPMLAARGAEFYFDAVRMRPGRPVLFGKVAGRLFFGLPGNPLGTMLAFELLVRPALELLGGVAEVAPPFVGARLGYDYRGPALGLTVFRPARRAARGLETVLEEIPYHGSADLAAAAAADCFWRVPEGTTEVAAGSAVQMVLK